LIGQSYIKTRVSRLTSFVRIFHHKIEHEISDNSRHLASIFPDIVLEYLAGLIAGIQLSIPNEERNLTGTKLD
jgi:hypothetical protein